MRKTVDGGPPAPIVPKARPDFVNVRLSAAGLKHLGDRGAVTFTNRHMHYTFKPGETQEVVSRYEWQTVLRHQYVNGEPMFEIAPPATSEGDPDGIV